MSDLDTLMAAAIEIGHRYIPAFGLASWDIEVMWGTDLECRNGVDSVMAKTSMFVGEQRAAMRLNNEYDWDGWMNAGGDFRLIIAHELAHIVTVDTHFEFNGEFTPVNWEDTIDRIALAITRLEDGLDCEERHEDIHA